MDIFHQIGQLIQAAGNAVGAHHQVIQQTAPAQQLQGAMNPQLGAQASALAHANLAAMHSALAGNPALLQHTFNPQAHTLNPQAGPARFNDYQSGVANPQYPGQFQPGAIHPQIQLPQLKMLQLYSNLGLQGSHPNLQQAANPQIRNYSPQR